MKKMIARLTGWPLVCLRWGFGDCYRFVRTDASGFHVMCFDRRITLDRTDKSRDFRPFNFEWGEGY